MEDIVVEWKSERSKTGDTCSVSDASLHLWTIILK